MPLLAMLLLGIGINGIPRLSFWKYIKNKIEVGAVLTSVLYLGLHLYITISENIEEVVQGDFRSAYTLQYSDAFKRFSAFEYVSGNSTYAFLYSNQNSRAVAVPRAEIVSMSPRKN